MAALNNLAKAKTPSQGIVLLVQALLDDPCLDINKIDNNDVPTIFKMVTGTDQYSNDKSYVFKTILNRKDIDINMTWDGNNIVMYFIQCFFSDRVNRSLENERTVLKNLASLIRFSNLSREMLTSGLHFFLENPKLETVCEHMSTEDFTVHNNKLAICLASIIKLLLGLPHADSERIQSEVKAISEQMTKSGLETSKIEFICAILEDILSPKSSDNQSEYATDDDCQEEATYEQDDNDAEETGQCSPLSF